MEEEVIFALRKEIGRGKERRPANERSQGQRWPPNRLLRYSTALPATVLSPTRPLRAHAVVRIPFNNHRSWSVG